MIPYTFSNAGIWFSQPVFFLVFMTFLLLLAKVDKENDDKIFFISIASFLYCSIVGPILTRLLPIRICGGSSSDSWEFGQ